MLNESFDVGDSIIIEYTVKEREPFEDYKKFEPGENSDPVQISIKSESGKEIADTPMNKYEDHKYQYTWNTINLDPGYYYVEIKVEKGSSTHVDKHTIKLIGD